MSISDRIDAEARVPLDALLSDLPGGFNAIPDITARRTAVAALLKKATAGIPANENVVVDDRQVPGPTDHRELTVRVYRPVAATGLLPGMLYIHGGGMILGTLESEHVIATMLCERVNAVVVAVDYRLAPEHPFPAGPEDCYAGLVWMNDNSPALGVDPERIAIYGGSAGGGLTCAVTLMARDRRGPRLCFQMPIYPMIDDTNSTPSSHEILDVGIWDRAGNVEAWKMYLGAVHGSVDVSPYAAPARATDLRGLPPAFIDVGELDLFRDEDIQYAARLLHAGVTTEFHLYPGSYHAAEVFAPDSALARRIWATRIAALERALGSVNIATAMERQA
ncbi:MAG: alpha/beta hydrolase [Acidobacteriota bacterium]|nr:alpha/beta hydrolase [Acidobacteriota bacterium]